LADVGTSAAPLIISVIAIATPAAPLHEPPRGASRNDKSVEVMLAELAKLVEEEEPGIIGKRVLPCRASIERRGVVNAASQLPLYTTDSRKCQ
jgi:hypothetical protein